MAKVVEETARLSIEAKPNESKVGQAEDVTVPVTEKVSEVAKETVTEISSVQPVEAQIEQEA